MMAFASGGIVNGGYRTVAEHDRICVRTGNVPSPHDGPTRPRDVQVQLAAFQQALRRADFAMKELAAAMRGELKWFRFGVELRRLNDLRLKGPR